MYPDKSYGKRDESRMFRLTLSNKADPRLNSRSNDIERKLFSIEIRLNRNSAIKDSSIDLDKK